ncbi:hypothetical protein PybrP1_012931 [[Pythium] brassicae (nom. inval.)]|nr:hypothetical protein PybrP1_012931 [[Pythium] brassicae (nom. inval.)]
MDEPGVVADGVGSLAMELSTGSGSGANGNGSSTDGGSSSATPSSEQWRVFLGLAILVASYLFRVELVRFSLRLARRALPGARVWLHEFEKTLLQPLSWVVFVLFLWLAAYVTDLNAVARLDDDTTTSLITLLLGFPLVWVVIAFCNYITWGIIRVKGWNRAASKDDDDYSRVMIITEGIGVIKILLVATVVSSFMIDEIGQITKFDSSQISTVAVMMVEVVFVFGAHSWLKNIMGGLMALIDEQIKSGAHIRFQGHEGVVERVYLPCFSLRQYDKGLAYIPNGILLENTVEIQSKRLDRRCVVAVHLSHRTKAATVRLFIQELDSFLLHLHAEKHARRKTKAALTLGGGGGSARGEWEKPSKRAAAEDDDEPASARFWISVEDSYTVHVVYFTHERHIKQIMEEKTEVVLQITELLAKLKLKLHGDEAAKPTLSPRDAAALELDAALAGPNRGVNFSLLRGLGSRGDGGAPTSLPSFDRFRRQLSEHPRHGGGTLRQRRQQSARL